MSMENTPKTDPSMSVSTEGELSFNPPDIAANYILGAAEDYREDTFSVEQHPSAKNEQYSAVAEHLRGPITYLMGIGSVQEGRRPYDDLIDVTVTEAVRKFEGMPEHIETLSRLVQHFVGEIDQSVERQQPIPGEAYKELGRLLASNKSLLLPIQLQRDASERLFTEPDPETRQIQQSLPPEVGAGYITIHPDEREGTPQTNVSTPYSQEQIDELRDRYALLKFTRDYENNGLMAAGEAVEMAKIERIIFKETGEILDKSFGRRQDDDNSL